VPRAYVVKMQQKEFEELQPGDFDDLIALLKSKSANV
jgi:hypothetical protein